MTNVQLNLQEVTEAFGIIYKAIDIRTVALRHETSWVNIFTVVRVSHEPPALVDTKHDELKSLHVLPRQEDVRISLSSRPFSDWQELCNGLKNSTLRDQSGGQVRLSNALDIYSKNGYVQRHHNVLRAGPDLDWPTCEVSFPHNPNQAEQLGMGNRLLPLMDRKTVQQISQFGHSNVFDAIDAFMELATPFASQSGLEFYVAVPVLAAIDSLVMEPEGNILSVRGRFHEQMPNVRFFAVCRDAPANSGLTPRATLALEVDETSGQTKSGIREVSASVAVPRSVKLSDYIEVKVVSTLGDIDADQAQIRSLLPAHHVQPIYHALSTFRSPTLLCQALTHPQAKQRSKTQPWNVQDYFERDVCWFLSCFGFAAVMLGEYESLRDAESHFEWGSLDILAYNEPRNVMLLAACTLKAPKDEDFNNLTTLRTKFIEEIFAGANTSIIPVIFTGLKTFRPYWEDVFDDNNLARYTVPILDGTRLEAALVLVKNKREQSFFSFLSNPSGFNLS